MRTQQELTALGEALKTYELKSPMPPPRVCWALLTAGLALLAIGLYLGQILLGALAIIPLGYGLFIGQKLKNAPPSLSVTLHQKGVNPICSPYNKAWLFEDIEYNYMFQTGPTKDGVPYNNLAFRRNEQNPWFIIPAEMPEFADFLQRYQALYYEHRFPKLLKKIIQGHSIEFAYVVEDATLVRSFIEKTFDTPTKTLTLNQKYITIDGEAHALIDLKLDVINKQKNFIALTHSSDGRLIFGNDYMGIFNHNVFIDLLIHLMAVQDRT